MRISRLLLRHGAGTACAPLWLTAAALKVDAPDAVSLREASDIRADINNNPCGFVRADKGQFRVECILEGHAIGMAEAAGLNLDQDLMRLWLRHLDLRHRIRRIEFLDLNGLHDFGCLIG